MIKTMGDVGIFPKPIATPPIPKCARCMLSDMTNKPWCTKDAAKNQVGRKTNITRPGQSVYVDKLESPQVGFIAQLKDIPIKKRY